MRESSGRKVKILAEASVDGYVKAEWSRDYTVRLFHIEELRAETNKDMKWLEDTCTRIVHERMRSKRI